MEKFATEIESFFMNNPKNFGYVFIALGILLLLGAICNWQWMVKSRHTYNLSKIDGWTNWFGPTVGRILYGMVGAAFLIWGILWFFLV